METKLAMEICLMLMLVPLVRTDGLLPDSCNKLPSIDYKDCEAITKDASLTQAEKKEGIEAFMGSRVHETLEKLYNDLRMTKQNSLEDLLSYYENEWEKNWNENVVIVKEGLKSEHYFDLGKKCVSDYYARHRPFDSDKTIACEKLISFSLDSDGKYKMRGYIDRLAEEKPGHYAIHDYKTSNSLPLQNHFDEDRQLALYSIAVREDFADCKDVGLCWHYLAFDKDMCSKRTEKQLAELKKEMIELIKRVEKAEKENCFPVKESRLCEWCKYSEVCPAKKHATKVERLPAREFRKDEGVKLVNEYVELRGRLKSAETDLERLEGYIFSYADKFELEKIVGSEAALRICKSIGFSFAGLGKEEKADLLELLKREKLLGEFMQLDTRALGAAVGKQEIEKDAAKKIKKFGEEKETRSVRLVKK